MDFGKMMDDAGKGFDEFANNAGKSFEEAGKGMNDFGENAKKQVEEAGKGMGEFGENARKQAEEVGKGGDKLGKNISQTFSELVGNALKQAEQVHTDRSFFVLVHLQADSHPIHRLLSTWPRRSRKM